MSFLTSASFGFYVSQPSFRWFDVSVNLRYGNLSFDYIVLGLREMRMGAPSRL